MGGSRANIDRGGIGRGGGKNGVQSAKFAAGAGDKSDCDIATVALEKWSLTDLRPAGGGVTYRRAASATYCFVYSTGHNIYDTKLI